MPFLKKLIGNIEVTKDLLLLLGIGGLYSLSIALSNTFVNVYLWKQSGEFRAIAIYNLAVFVFQLAAFIAAGRWAKKVDRVLVLRAGVIFLAVFFIVVLVFGEHSSRHLALLGGLLGIGYGLYWLAFNVLTFEITEPETRDFFNGLLGTLSSAGGMVGPLAAGFIITRFASNFGYTIIFAASLILFAGAVVLSLLLKRRGAEGQFHFWAIAGERKRNRNWRLVTNAHFLQGLRDGSFVFIISILIFLSTGSEFSLGTFGLLNSAVSFLAYTLIAKWIKKGWKKKVMLLGGILLYASLFIIAFDLSFPRLLLYGAVIGLSYPLMLVPYSSMTYDVIGLAWKAAEMRIEYIVVREVFLNLGRVFSILAFLLAISMGEAETVVPYFLLVVGAGHLGASILLQKLKFS